MARPVRLRSSWFSRWLGWFAGFACAVLPACACNRAEPDAAPPPTTARQATPPEPQEEPAPPPAAKPERCLVPLAEPPPKKALPAAKCPKDPGGAEALPRGWVSFVELPGSPRVAVEIAETDGSRERGLMYRTSMPEDQGMIFSWNEESPRTFWMHNTCIPLDMLFVAKDGTIVGALDEVPVLDDSPRGVPCPAAYVLELNAGWTRSHGLRPGMHLSLER